MSGTHPVTVTPLCFASLRTALTSRFPQTMKFAAGISCCTTGRTSAAEPLDGIDIGAIVHDTSEADRCRLLCFASWAEIVEVDAVADAAHRNSVYQPLEIVPFDFGMDDCAGECARDFPFISQ